MRRCKADPAGLSGGDRAEDRQRRITKMPLGEEARYLRVKAPQFRKLGDECRAGISAKPRQLAGELEARAEELERAARVRTQ